MTTKVIVTDLTRFAHMEEVCIAGLSFDGQRCIRPRPYLARSRCVELNILPGTILEGRFECRHSAPPHIEDHSYSNLRICGPCSSECFRGVLDGSRVPTVAEGFAITLPKGQKHIPIDRPPNRSIITIPVDPRGIQIVSSRYNGKPKAHLTDESGREFSFLSITDLGFHEYATQCADSRVALRRLNDFIHEQEEIYVRVGLSHEHETDDGRRGFWLQVNGIYTFPEFFEQIRCYR